MARVRMSAAFLLLAGGLAACLVPARARADGLHAVATADGREFWLAGDGGAVWRSTDGGAGYAAEVLGASALRAVAARGNTVLVAGDSGQVWRTTDRGAAWTLRTTPGLAAVRALAMPSPGRAYLAGDGGLLMRSDDGGATWSALASGTPQTLGALAFTDDDHGWAAGAAGTLLRTADGGAHWDPVALGTAAELSAVAARGGEVWVGSAAGGCWRSPDGGASFAFVDLGADLEPEVAAIALPAGGAVWIAGGGGYVRRSRDGGATWTWPVHALHGAVGGIAFAESSGVVTLRSARIAAHWAGGDSLALPEGAMVSREWTRQLDLSGRQIRGNTLAVTPGVRSTFRLVAGNVIFRSGDDGETWAPAGSLPGQNRANVLLISPRDTSVFLVAAVSTAGLRQLLVSPDAGTTWSPTLTHPFGEYGASVERHPDRPDTLYFGGESDVLYRSVDGGFHWSPWGTTRFRSPCDLAVVPGDADRIVVADGTSGSGRARLWLSTDAGAGFTLRDSVGGSEVPMLAVSRQRPSDLFAMSWTAVGASVSRDGGGTWEPIADLHRQGQDVSATWGTDVARDDPNVVLVGTFAGGAAYLSLDGAATFEPLDLPGTNYVMFARDRGSVYALQSLGLYRLRTEYAYVPADAAQALAVTSPNGGEVWEGGSVHDVTWDAAYVERVRIEWRRGPSAPWSFVAEVDAAPGRYAWTVPLVPTPVAGLRLADAGDGSPMDEADAAFRIEAPPTVVFAPVAPSPVKAGEPARVSFELPRAARVELDVYDVQGHRVLAVTDRVFDAGPHVLDLRTSDLRAGVYFVNLRAGDFTAARRVLVLR